MPSTSTKRKAAMRTEATEADVKTLQAELEQLKKEFSERISAMEAMLPVEPSGDHIPAETLAVIAAAVTAFLGKKVKIRSAQLLPTVNPWGQVGRSIVQASHNLQR
jgi:hypothetical protein